MIRAGILRLDLNKQFIGIKIIFSIVKGVLHMRFQNLYDKSPISFQNIMATVYGFKAKKERYGDAYYKHLDFLNKFIEFSEVEQKDFQFNELINLIRHAVEHSTFYRELYKGIDIESFKSLDDIVKLPVLTKEMLRENINEINTLKKESAIKANTGGTTGKSLTVYFEKNDFQRRMATLDHFKTLHGFNNITMKRATFSGKHIIPSNQKEKVFWRKNHSIKQMLYSSFHITDDNIPYYIKSLNEFKPVSLDGFISSIYDIASFIMRNGISLEFYPKVIFSTSETVTQEHRDIIEEVFKCKIRDQYASSEGAPFVWECNCSNLHYDTSSGIIEKNNNSNEVLVTSFTTYGTPLIRYEIGDNMEFEDENIDCKCGLKMPIVKSIQGRSTDFLYSTSGAKITAVNIANGFKYMPNSIIKAQLIQESMSSLLVKLIVDSKFTSEDEFRLKREIQRKFGIDMAVKIQIVEEIPREKSGKYRMVINNVETG
jgi:phenylacetate-CoA ligase